MSEVPCFRIMCDARGQVAVHGTAARAIESRTYIGDHVIADAFGSCLPAPLADVVDVALAVYSADRLCRRPSGSRGQENSWRRQIMVSVPVRDPAPWRSSYGDELAAVLFQLTDDAWSFEFTPHRTVGRRSETQQHLFTERPAVSRAALFSGGLDSFAGLATVLLDAPDEHFVLFAGRSTRRLAVPQRALLQAIELAAPGRLNTVAVSLGFRNRTRGAFDYDEPTQRSRAFLFQALGAVTARAAGLCELMMFENGIGAINLPYTAAQIGSQATRGAHPASLYAIGTWLSHVLGAQMHVCLPFAYRTKAELCARLAASPLALAANATVSCDGFPQRVAGRPQCGVCPSCVLRRQSMWAGGLATSDRQAPYRYDLFHDAQLVASERGLALRMMDAQVGRFTRLLASGEPWPSWASAYPTLLEAAAALPNVAPSVAAADVPAALLDLYRRYSCEWRRFVAALNAGLSSEAMTVLPEDAEPALDNLAQQ